MVAELIAYHPAIAHYLRFVATTVGRDKVLRTLQYWSRFYAWYLFRTNSPESAIKPWSTIKSQFGLTRKLLRVGKNIEHFRAAAVAFNAKPPAATAGHGILKYLTIGRQLGYAVYLTFDMFTYLHAAGIKKFESNKKLTLHAAKAWFIGLLCSVLAGVYSLVTLKQRERTISRKEGEGVLEAKKIERERTTIITQLVSDLSDIINPATTIGYINFDDGIIGLAGVVSSLIGLRSAWRKTA
ncbi:Peroxisomal membrane protein PMP27 [Ascosphaera aggregata]|nr:Peroxisomal membrane protein PMP27 [Ascosphaera aggregata]